MRHCSLKLLIPLQGGLQEDRDEVDGGQFCTGCCETQTKILRGLKDPRLQALGPEMSIKKKTEP